MFVLNTNVIMVTSCLLIIYCNAEVFTQCYEGWCYQLSNSTLTWDSADLYCKDFDAQLASIHSSDENQFILENVKGPDNCRIGLNDIDEEGVFQWIDGTPVNYTNFNEGEPNNNDGAEHTAVMRFDGKWNDAAGSKARYAVCKRKKITLMPGALPTQVPTAVPTTTSQPTAIPSIAPTSPAIPSISPTSMPTVSPSVQPSTTLLLSVLVLAIINSVLLCVIICFFCHCVIIPKSRSDIQNSKVPKDQPFEIERRGYFEHERMYESDVIPGVIAGKTTQKGNETRKEIEMLLPSNVIPGVIAGKTKQKGDETRTGIEMLLPSNVIPGVIEGKTTQKGNETRKEIEMLLPSNVIPGVIAGKASQKGNEIQKEIEKLLPSNTEGRASLKTTVCKSVLKWLNKEIFSKR